MLKCSQKLSEHVEKGLVTENQPGAQGKVEHDAPITMLYGLTVFSGLPRNIALCSKATNFTFALIKPENQTFFTESPQENVVQLTTPRPDCEQVLLSELQSSPDPSEFLLSVLLFH